MSVPSTIPTTKTWYELSWPASLDPKQLTTFLQALHSAYSSSGIRFVILADDSGIKHYIVVPNSNASTISQLLNTFLPEVEAAETVPFELRSGGTFKVKLSTKNRVLNTEQPELVSHVILNTLANLRDGERIIMEWVLGSKRSPRAIHNVAIQHEMTSWFGRWLEAFVRQPKQLNSHSHASMQAKLGVPNWRANMFVGFTAVDYARAKFLINQMAHAINSAQAPGVNLALRWTFPASTEASHIPSFWSLLININELSGLLAWPLGDQPLAGIERATSRHLSVPDNPLYTSRILAVSNMAGSNKTLALSPRDALMHTHVIGPTGAGKSTLLLNLITQDIYQGRGVIVVEPKGDLVNEVLKRIPDNRRNDVVVIDPSDNNFPVGLNPLARHNQPAALIADDILSVFRGLYGTSFGPRSADLIHAGVLTLCSTSGMSLCTLPILYTNPVFRSRLVNKLSDPLGLGSFWGWFNALSDAERNRVLAPVMNKLRAFLLRPSMRQVIGQGTPKFDMGSIVSGKKIVLVNLAKGALGSETSRLFGSLVVSQVWQAIQGRTSMPMDKRLPIFTYVDEVQDYLHLPTDISEVLEQSRSYGMGLILAHQHLGQLPPGLRNSVLTNARSRVCFQLSHEDALVMSHSSKVLEPGDFENLNRYNIYARLVRDGQVLPWASGKTLEPIEAISDPNTLRRLSRYNYGQDVAEVEAELVKQIDGSAFTDTRAAIGRKTGSPS